MTNEVKVNITASATDAAEGAVKFIDGIAQIGERREQQKLKTQALAQELQESQQKTEREQQIHYLDLEMRRLDLEERHLVLEKHDLELKKQELELQEQELKIQEQALEFKKKQFEIMLTLAEKTVDVFHPGADQQTRALEIRGFLPTLFPTLVQAHEEVSQESPLLVSTSIISITPENDDETEAK